MHLKEDVHTHILYYVWDGILVISTVWGGILVISTYMYVGVGWAFTNKHQIRYLSITAMYIMYVERDTISLHTSIYTMAHLFLHSFQLYSDVVSRVSRVHLLFIALN